MQRDATYMMDILDAAKLAVSYVSDKNEEEFLLDFQCQDAVIRRLEIIGEAAGRLSDKIRSKYDHLPWTAMIGMRNIMIHKYDDVDLTIVWETVKSSLPELIAALEKIQKG